MVEMALAYGPIKLQFKAFVEPKDVGELVPYYHFKMMNEDRDHVGHINFRVGLTNHVMQCAGHLGYEVNEAYRGASYAYYACKAMRPWIQTFYSEVVLTAEVDNMASIHTIEKLGAQYLETITVPKTDPAYLGGARKKLRYIWRL